MRNVVNAAILAQGFRQAPGQQSWRELGPAECAGLIHTDGWPLWSAVPCQPCHAWRQAMASSGAVDLHWCRNQPAADDSSNQRHRLESSSRGKSYEGHRCLPTPTCIRVFYHARRQPATNRPDGGDGTRKANVVRNVVALRWHYPSLYNRWPSHAPFLVDTLFIFLFLLAEDWP